MSTNSDKVTCLTERNACRFTVIKSINRTVPVLVQSNRWFFNTNITITNTNEYSRSKLNGVLKSTTFILKPIPNLRTSYSEVSAVPIMNTK